MRSRVSSSFAALLLASVSFLAPAARADWPSGGIRVSASYSAKFSPCVGSDGAGGAFVAWTEESGPDRLVRAQHLTRDGTVAPGWPRDGILVSAAVGFYDGVTMVADGQGGAYVAWDTADLYGGVGMAHLNSSAVALPAGSRVPAPWATASPASTGVPSPEKRRSGDALPGLAADGAGGVFFVWLHSTELFGCFAGVYHRWADGTTGAGNSIFAGYCPSAPVACADGAGGVIVAVASDCGSDDGNILVNHFAATGALAPGWSSARWVLPSSGHRDAPGIVSDGAGGAILAWQEGTGRPYAQRLSADTSFTWGDQGIPLCTKPTTSGVTRGLSDGRGAWFRYSAIVPDGAGGAIVAWVDHRGGDSTGTADLYAQRVTHDGTIAPGWPVDGAPICTAPRDQLLPSIVPDGSGGALLVWKDARSDTSGDIYAQHLDATGAPAAGWPVDGIGVSATPDEQEHPAACSDGAGGAIVAWIDWRSGTPDVYAAHVAPDHVVPTLISFAGFTATPGRVHLTWLVQDRILTATAYRRKAGEEEWVNLGELSPDGSGRIELEDRDVVANTRYEYRLGVMREGREVFLGSTSVLVPGSLSLALQGMLPNPATDELRVSFTLAVAAPATLELIDLGGRRLSKQDVGSLGPGAHVLDLRLEHRVPPGLYWLRLGQSGRLASAKVSVTR